jgi:hypothetical protein
MGFVPVRTRRGGKRAGGPHQPGKRDYPGGLPHGQQQNGTPPRIASGAALFELRREPSSRRLHQPCSPPSSQMIRMIGIGIPISHNSKPRPMLFLLTICREGNAGR